MKPIAARAACVNLCVTCLGLLVFGTAPARAGNWPAWRGASADGVLPAGEPAPPVSWSTTENVTWKVPLPGPGNATPVVWGNRVFLTCASEKGAVRSVMCFDRADGKVLWRKDTPFAGKELTHDGNPYCSSSPVTDGKRVFAFHGSAGAVAYDVDGKKLWHRDLGPFDHIWGNASSPVLYKGMVILYCGPGPQSVMVALKQDTGETVWENKLPEARGKDKDHWFGTWGTPLLREVEGRTELVLGLPLYVAGFDPDSGKEVWRCRGLGDLVYTSPLIGNDHIVAMSGYGGPALGMRGPKAGETGDLTDSHRLWVVPKNQQRIGSGIIVGPHVYMVNDPGVAECIELDTGKVVWHKRAAGSTWSSLSLADGKFYISDMGGETAVFTADPTGIKEVATNALGDMIRASLAFSDGQVFVHTYGHLYCIGKPAAAGDAAAAGR